MRPPSGSGTTTSISSESDWSYTDGLGNRLGQRVTPLERVGLYVPGGQAAYPSTVLMTAVPAKVAGVPSLLMTVPTPGGVRNDLVLAAAHVAGVDGGFCIGGAQAIAALAYGTESIPRVDKIVGPGGAYVAAAKRQVYGEVGIDLIAGPSEVLVIADDSAPVSLARLGSVFTGRTRRSGAGTAAESRCRNCSIGFIQRCPGLLVSQPRRQIIETSLAQRGALIHTRSLEEAFDLANRVAPEHLQLCVRNPETWLESGAAGGRHFPGCPLPGSDG